MLAWNPRDVDTLEQIYHERAEAAEQQAREERFAAASRQVLAGMTRR